MSFAGVLCWCALLVCLAAGKLADCCQPWSLSQDGQPQKSWLIFKKSINLRRQIVDHLGTQERVEAVALIW